VVRISLALVVLVACSSPAAEKKPPTGPTNPTGPTAPVTRDAPPAPKPTGPVELTCKTVSETPAPGYCGILEKAPRVDSAAVASTVAVWRKVEAPFRALSGRETALVVLSPEARIDDGGKQVPIPPAAYICPGAPPQVYVPSTLLALIDNKDAKKYPDDFLAFVLGHELGHRMNDLTPDGCQLGAFQRPGKGANEEELADARSAFFITTAGYSASKVAKQDMVRAFLEAEYKLGRDETKTRYDSLLGSLSKFDDYEALYQAGLSVAMSGDMDAADRLLSWADDLVQSHGVLLPELRVMRAITRIERAQKIAPWGAELELPVGLEGLHCTPLHPGHSGLWQEPEERVRGDFGRGKKLLKEALALLDEAEARGGTPFTIATARACANVYLADADAAARDQARAEALAETNKSAVVKGVLADNRALVTFVTFARQNKVPAIDDSKGLDAWADKLAAAVGANASPSLASVIEAMRDPGAKPKPVAKTPPACTGGKASASFAAVSAPDASGACPTGYKTAHTLVPDGDAKGKQGVSVCSSTTDDSTLVAVRLPAIKADKLDAYNHTLRWSRPPAALSELGTWACTCASVDRSGVSDHGNVMYRASCPALKLDSVVIDVANGKVETVIQQSR